MIAGPFCRNCDVRKNMEAQYASPLGLGYKNMQSGMRYEFHHMGIPTSEKKEGEIYSAVVGMYTTDHPGSFKIQWHRFDPESPLHPLIKTLPHLAFKVDDLHTAIQGKDVILGPYEPIDDYFVAIINDGGVPIELIQTKLSDSEIWRRAKDGEGALYRSSK